MLRLAEKIPKHVNHKLYFDNWFNSSATQIELSKNRIQSVGTLPVNRANLLKFDFDHPRRVNYLVKVVDNHKLYATQWYDNKPVTFLSTFIASEPEIAMKRFDRKTKTYIEVPAPAVLDVYNRHMGYADEINSYLGQLRMTDNSLLFKILSILHNCNKLLGAI